jgi:putative ABC transport system permease protein
MQDIRALVAGLLRRPFTPAIIVTTLALCLGATATVFTVVDGLLLRPLPVPHPEELVTIDGPAGDGTPWTYAIWQEINRRPELFAGAMAWNATQIVTVTSGQIEVANLDFVSSSFFSVLGVTPELGRIFATEDDARGGGSDGPVAILSHTFWRRRFGGDPAIIGQTVTLGTRRVKIVGVTPPEFLGPDVGRAVDVMMPLGLVSPATLDGRATWWLSIVARLKSNQTMATGNAALAAVQQPIREATRPDDVHGTDLEHFDHDATFHLQSASTGISPLRARYGSALLLLLAAVGAVMLVACANVANLMLTRAVSRSHEMSVRVALGASRRQLVSALLIESGLLAIAGAVIGLAVAQVGSRVLVAQIASDAARVTLNLTPDGRVLGFTLATAIGMTLIFGVVPAFRAARANPGDALKASGRTLARGGRLASADALVALQIGISLVLVVGAGLFVRTFVTLTHEPLGFDADRLVTASLQLPSVPKEQVLIVAEEAQKRVATVPGVESAALSLITPMSGMVRRAGFTVRDVPDAPQASAFVNCVSPEWFRTTKTPLVAGRDFTSNDRRGMPNVAIVNETFVRALFRGADPLGRIITSGSQPNLTEMTVVGVVADSYYRNLRETLQPIVYQPLEQTTSLPGVEITVRAAALPASSLVRPLAAAIGDDKRVRSVTTTMSSQIAASVRQERLVAWLSGALGALALVLSAVGLYGVTEYAIASRRRELGIRLMLGSDPARLVATTLGRVGLVVGCGLAAGVLASLLSTRYIATLLFGVKARDPLTLGLAAAVLTLVAAIAAWRPIRGATRIDPVEVLRQT